MEHKLHESLANETALADDLDGCQKRRWLRRGPAIGGDRKRTLVVDRLHREPTVLLCSDGREFTHGLPTEAFRQGEKGSDRRDARHHARGR